MPPRQSRLSQRARIILLAAGGCANLTIAARVGLDRRQVGVWRSRWQQSPPALEAIQQSANSAELRRTIEDSSVTRLAPEARGRSSPSRSSRSST